MDQKTGLVSGRVFGRCWSAKSLQNASLFEGKNDTDTDSDEFRFGEGRQRVRLVKPYEFEDLANAMCLPKRQF